IDPEVERDARNVERIEPQDVGPDEPVFLQQAAPQDGDGPRVRSYGIDDVDLFSDERMVARDVIDSPDRAGPES
ncbi:MAG: PPE domain-containing protein, partial [Haloechinothrix sp.]